MLDLKSVDEILSKSPYSCALITDDYRLIYMNSIMEKNLSPNSGEEILNRSIIDLIIEGDRESFAHFINHSVGFDKKDQWKTFHLVNSGNRHGKVILNKSGNVNISGFENVILLTGLPFIPDEQQDLLIDEIIHNLSNKYTYKKYETFFNNAFVGLAIFNEKGVVEDVNSTFIEQFGLSKDEVVNAHYEQIFNMPTIKNISNLLEKIRKDDRVHLKNVITLEEGNNHKLYEISLAKFKSEKHDSPKFMFLSEDITNQQDTHAALIQSEKLALTGRLAASLAHEINNPLQTSVGCLGLVEEMLGDKDQEIAVYITMAMEELQRSARIVKKLRDLNRKADISEKSPVNIKKIIEDVLLLTKNRLYDRNIVPIFPHIGPPPVTIASKDQIHQVILNLIMNAIDALPQGGNIYIDLIPTDHPEGLNIKIRDTGPGIDPEVMSHLYDPFYTTKEDGLGLGLYNCKQIIDEHSGSLDVESEPGKGTVFTVWLPGLQPLTD